MFLSRELTNSEECFRKKILATVFKRLEGMKSKQETGFQDYYNPGKKQSRSLRLIHNYSHNK